MPKSGQSQKKKIRIELIRIAEYCWVFVLVASFQTQTDFNSFPIAIARVWQKSFCFVCFYFLFIHFAVSLLFFHENANRDETWTALLPYWRTCVVYMCVFRVQYVLLILPEAQYKRCAFAYIRRISNTRWILTITTVLIYNMRLASVVTLLMLLESLLSFSKITTK